MSEFRTKVRWYGDRIKINASRASTESIYDLGLYAEKQAKQYAAKWYGYLAASINTQSRSRGTNVESPQIYARRAQPERYSVEGFNEIKKPRSDRTVFVGTNVVYAMAIEFGRGPYSIPKGGGLNPKIMTDGTNFYGYKVTHPGFTAKPYLRPAMDDAMAHAEEILKPKFQNL